MASRIKIRSGTRAALDAATAASQLIQYEPLFITDEQRFGVATAVNAYATAAKEGEGGGSGASLWVSTDPPANPALYPFWLDTDANDLMVYKGSEDGFVNVSIGYAGTLIWVDTVAPPDPLISPFWWNNVSGVLQFYPNSFHGWQTVGAGGGLQYTISATAPDPEVYPFWFNLAGEQFVWDGEFWFQVSGGTPEHSHLASEISDFAEAAREQIESALVAGTGVSIVPSGSGATRILTINASATPQSPILSWAI